MKKLLASALLVGLFVGCYSNLDSFQRRFSKIGCINVQECLPEQFAAEFASVGECADAVEAEVDGIFAGCSYDAKIGRKCIHAAYRKRKDCDLLDMGTLPECQGAVLCPNSLDVDGNLARRLVGSLVTASLDLPVDGAPNDDGDDEPIEID